MKQAPAALVTQRCLENGHGASSRGQGGHVSPPVTVHPPLLLILLLVVATLGTDLAPLHREAIFKRRAQPSGYQTEHTATQPFLLITAQKTGGTAKRNTGKSSGKMTVA